MSKKRKLVKPSQLGDYVIPGWSLHEQVVATISVALAFLGICVLAWVLR